MKRVQGNKDLARLVWASVTRPVNAALTGAGLLFAVVGPQHPWLGILGGLMLVGTAGSVGRDLTNKEFLTEVLTDGSSPRALPEIPENLTGQYRMRCLEAKRHLDRTMEAIETAGPDVSEEMFRVREQIVESVQKVYSLAVNAQHIDNRLASSSRNEILKEIEKIKAQVVLTSDPISRQHLERTREQKEQQLESYEALALQVKRIQAQMQHIIATLDNVQFKVLEIGSAEFGPGSPQADEITSSLQEMLQEVNLFLKSMDAAHGESEGLSLPGTLESWDARAQRRQLTSGRPEDTPESESHPTDLSKRIQRHPTATDSSNSPGSGDTHLS